MEARVSLLEEVKKGGYEASLFTTFNAYLPFYEDVVLRKLVSQGVRHNVLMMDHMQCQQSFANQPPRFAGRHYSLLPMRVPGAFHPKVILLLGKKKGLLAVGSHNLTLSGFGNNLELTNLVRYSGDADADSAAVLKQAWKFIQSWAQDQGEWVPKHILKMVENVATFAPWLSEAGQAPEDVSVIASSGAAPSLFAQLRSKLSGRVTRAIVVGAFFDSQLGFLGAIRRDLNPAELIVAIDPSSVQAPPSLETMEGIRVVDASVLKSFGAKDAAATQYLHAKSMVIETDNSKRYLVSGSANPSAPAWLTSGGNGNTEMMMVRSDPAVDQALEKLGLLRVEDAPQIQSEDWGTVAENWNEASQYGDEHVSVGIAVAHNDRIQFETHERISAPVCCELLDAEGGLLECVQFDSDQQNFKVQPKQDYFPAVAFVRVLSDGNLAETYFVHHEAQISEHSRTGTQRKFREALSSLDFSSPDLETFLGCVERIVFAKADKVNQSTKSTREKTDNNPQVPKQEGDGFAIDLSDTKKSKKKHRLKTQEDLAYLIDVLIYHVKVDDEVMNSYDSVDQMKRNEEEQVGADDPEEVLQAVAGHDAPEPAQILEVCHRKVKTLVNRMTDNLAAFKKQTIGIQDLIVRLTAVLAVLRELRNCDNNQSWVEKGQTTVPAELRLKLLDSILTNLFEGKESFWQLARHAPELACTDDVTQLKGLIIWLAWDCKLRFCNEKPFAEEPEDEEKRFLHNAWLLAVAQLIENDVEVVENAKQSIGPLCSGDLGWLDWMTRFGGNLVKLRAKVDELPISKASKPGDVGVHANLHHLGLRIVRKRYNDNKLAMIRFDKAKPLILYEAGNIKTFDVAKLAFH